MRIKIGSYKFSLTTRYMGLWKIVNRLGAFKTYFYWVWNPIDIRKEEK